MQTNASKPRSKTLNNENKTSNSCTADSGRARTASGLYQRVLSDTMSSAAAWLRAHSHYLYRLAILPETVRDHRAKPRLPSHSAMAALTNCGFSWKIQ
jgi:hypothetical protein